jgi:hypothetical protein
VAPASDTSEDEASPTDVEASPSNVELAESRAQLMLTKCGRPAPPQVTERYREIMGGASPAAGADDAEPIGKKGLSLFEYMRKKQEEDDAYRRRMEELERREAAEVEASDAAGALLAD